MPEFNAETSGVEPMAYDFTPWGVDAKGIIPEPSNKMMEKFQDRMFECMRKVQELDINDDSTEEDVKAAKKVTKQASKDMDANIAELCSDKPSAEECEQLPFRVKQAYAKWLMGQFRPAGAE